MKQLAMGRWRDRVSTCQVGERGAETIIKRVRARFLRRAFDRYLDAVKFVKKTDIEEERCRYLTQTIQERRKRQIYNNWLIYVNNFKTAKKYWYRIYLRMDLAMKQRTMKRWQEWSQHKSEKML